MYRRPPRSHRTSTLLPYSPLFRSPRYTSKPIFVKATAVRPRNLGALEVHGTWASSTPVDGPTVEASRAAYEIAGLGPSDVDVIQIQDTDAGAEIIHMAENGFCADGEQEELVQAEIGRASCRERVCQYV